MSLSKKLYEEGYNERFKCKLPILEVGQRFTIDYGYQKNLQGSWELICNKDAPFYLCSKVLKNDKLSKSISLDNCRRFFESNIYQAMKDK